MKCPDCGARLMELTMEGGDTAQRCGKCGGFFMNAWTVNRLTSRQLDLWRRISVSEPWMSGGTGMCPVDATRLMRYTGEAVPRSIPAMRCPRCSKWWFPRDSLFDFKPAQEAKVSYFKWWGVASDLSGLVLPVIAGLTILGGLVVGVKVVQERQKAAVEAREGVTDLTITGRGEGKVEVRFRSSQRLENIQIRGIDDIRFKIYGLRYEEGWYVARMDNLGTGRFVIRIAGKEWEFEIK